MKQQDNVITSTQQAEAELQVIRKIMQDSRNAVVDKGWHYIYWGVIVTIILFINYMMILNNVSMHSQGMLWFISMVSASFVEQIITRKIQKNEKMMNFSGRLLGTLWGISGICMFIFAFAGTLSGAYNPLYIFPVISCMLGVAYFISGTIQQVKWLKFITFGWWSGSIFMFIFPGIHSLLIFATMLILFQTIPGFILYKKWKVSLDEI